MKCVRPDMVSGRIRAMCEESDRADASTSRDPRRVRSLEIHATNRGLGTKIGRIDCLICSRILTNQTPKVESENPHET